MAITHVISLLLFPAVMAFAAASDFFTMTISNKVSLVLVAGFLLFALMIGMTPTTMIWHVGAATIVLAATFSLFAMGWIGGGDAKLAAATALWLGFEQLVPYLLYASILGGVLTVVLMCFRMAPLPAALEGQDWAQRLHRANSGVPYGLALAAAALMVYPHTVWMKAAG